MYDSSYYYKLMCSYAKSKRNYEDKKGTYNSCLEKIKNLNNCLPTIVDNLKSSSKNFLNGGYIDNNVPLDKGLLVNYYTKIEDYSTELNKIINNTELKIKEFSEKITYYKNLYNDAKTNYERAKREEMK